MSISHLSYAALAVAICVLIAGCKPKDVPVPDATPAPAVVDGTPATEADCNEFARKLVQAALTKNQAHLERLISLEALALRCLNDLSLTGNQRQSVARGIKSGVKQNALATQILADVEQGGSFKLLRIHDVDGRPRAMFRLIGTDTGVKYYDFIMSRSSDGQISVEDIYVFTTGEMLTQSLRRILLPVVAELNQGSVAKLRGADRTFLDNMPKFQAMVDAIRAENNPEAIKIYKALPESFRVQKAIVLLYLTATSGDEVEYANALDLFRKLFPDDAAVEFLSIDYFLLKKQYEDALRCIDRADVAVGGDPYLHVLRSNIHVEAKRFKEARAAVEKAIELEPTLADGYWSRINLALKEKNHTDTLVWLKQLVEKTTEKVTDLTKVAEYAEFVKSPQHAEWLKWYAGKRK